MRILFAADGSQGATRAARLLDQLPLVPDSEIRILSVATDVDDMEAHRALQTTETALPRQAAIVTRELCTGDPAQEILRAAERHAVDLIVLGSHGRSALARFLIGSVAERVTRYATCSVLLVRGEGELRRLAVGLDGSPVAATTVAWLRRFPLPKDCEVRLVTVVPNLHHIARERFLVLPILDQPGKTLDECEREAAHRHLDEMAQSLTGPDRRVVTEIRSGDPAEGLVRLVEDEGTDLLVVGDHGHTPLERFFLGSVSQNVSGHAPCSVLVVKQPVRARAEKCVQPA